MAVTWEASYGAAVPKSKQRNALVMVDFFSPY